MWQPCEYRDWQRADHAGGRTLAASVCHQPYGPLEPAIPAVHVWYPVAAQASAQTLEVWRQRVRDAVWSRWETGRCR